MTIKLYYNFLFPSSRTVYLFLKGLKIPFEAKQVAVKGTHISSDYRHLCKCGSLPMLEDNDFKIIESVAIIRYLSKYYPSSNVWYPADSKKQAKVDEYLSWQHHNTSFLCSLFYQQCMKSRSIDGKPDQKKIEPFKDRMADCLDNLEEVWLKESKFIAGDSCTVADISCLNDIEQAKLAGYDPKEDHPLLTAWMERVKTSLNPHFEEVMKCVLKSV